MSLNGVEGGLISSCIQGELGGVNRWHFSPLTPRLFIARAVYISDWEADHDISVTGAVAPRREEGRLELISNSWAFCLLPGRELFIRITHHTTIQAEWFSQEHILYLQYITYIISVNVCQPLSLLREYCMYYANVPVGHYFHHMPPTIIIVRTVSANSALNCHTNS